MKRLSTLIACLIMGMLVFTGNVFAQDSEYCNSLMGNNDGEKALFTWETVEGNIIMTINPFIPLETGTAFRNNGLMNLMSNLTVNNIAGDYFDLTVNPEKTQITLTPKQAIADGAVIEYTGIVEYATAINNNCWPTFTFTYTYGSVCPSLSQLSAPANIAIGADNVITFDAVANAVSYKVDVYSGTTLIHSQSITGSGSTISFTSPGNYGVRVTAIADGTNYTNSDESVEYAWTITEPTTVAPSTWCNVYFDPTGGGAIESDADAVYFSIETNLQGSVVVSIRGAYSETANFRINGMNVNNFRVGNNTTANGSDYFEKVETEGVHIQQQTFKLKEGVTLPLGTQIWYNGMIEYETSAFSNSYPTLNLGAYVYGSTCENAPQVSVDKEKVEFAPLMTSGPQFFILTGSNLTSDVTISVPKGLTVSETNLSPDVNGSINQVITVTWEEGSSSNGVITFSGGGVSETSSSIRIKTTSSGFSEFCNYVLTQNEGTAIVNPAYLTIALSEDNSVMTFTITPYEDGGSATWNGATLDPPASKVLVNGVDANAAKSVIDPNTITLTFSPALSANDVISFANGATFVWTITGYPNYPDNTNCYIDNWSKTYTVDGKSCDCFVYPVIVNATVEEPGETATIIIDALKGTEDISQVIFTETNGKVGNYSFAYNATGEYLLTGLSLSVEYSFDITVIDTEGNVSTIKNISFTNVVTGNTQIIVTENNITVYPNPVTDKLFLSSEVNEISFYSVQGILIYTAKNVKEVNVSNFTAGMYLVKMIDKQGIVAVNKVEVRK